ncbi:MAG TPA: hypothetical protein VN980_05905 [Alphaproteobacteria bacterium]|nr:hypothetical protein [Alphaproteobacteria bacterium]
MIMMAGLGRQDKSAAVGRAHVVGGVTLFDDCANVPCWRITPISQQFQCSMRHHLAYGKRPERGGEFVPGGEHAAKGLAEPNDP